MLESYQQLLLLQLPQQHRQQEPRHLMVCKQRECWRDVLMDRLGRRRRQQQQQRQRITTVSRGRQQDLQQKVLPSMQRGLAEALRVQQVMPKEAQDKALRGLGLGLGLGQERRQLREEQGQP